MKVTSMFKKTLILLVFSMIIAGIAKAQTEDNESVILIHEIPYSFEEAVKKARETINASNYRVFPERYLEQGLAQEDTLNKKQVTLRFCNFKTLHEAMQIEPRLGVVLPCKVTIVEDKTGTVKLITANISALSELFQNEKLKPLEQAIKDSYADIIDEVTL